MFAKSYHFYWIAGRVNILCKYLTLRIFNFGRGFCDSSSVLLPEAPASCDKKILK